MREIFFKAVITIFLIANSAFLACAQTIDSTDDLSIGVSDELESSTSYTSTPDTFTTGDALGYDDEIHQGYAVFSTSGISGTASGLSFSVIGASEGTIQNPVTLNLYAYTSTITPTADSTSFANMVSGPLIGTYTIPNGDYYGNSPLALNSTGVQLFNQDVADDLPFSIVSQLSPSDGEGYILGGLFRDPDYLELDVTAAPEPISFWLTLIAMNLFALVRFSNILSIRLGTSEVDDFR